MSRRRRWPPPSPPCSLVLELAKSSPGTEESALFDRFVDLIALCPGEYDRTVFDTAPTGLVNVEQEAHDINRREQLTPIATRLDAAGLA